MRKVEGGGGSLRGEERCLFIEAVLEKVAPFSELVGESKNVPHS